MIFESRARRRRNMKRLAIGSSVAAAAGYVAGVLTAPKSGKDTRADIKNAADKSLARAERQLKKLHTDLDQAIKDATEATKKASAKAQKDIKELVVKAKDAKEKARQVLSAIHEGEADDQDLNKAIKQANTSLKNLRNYLKK